MATVANDLFSEYPKFAHLVDVLRASLIAKNGASLESTQKLEQAQHKIAKEKQVYLTYKSIYDEVQEYLVDAELTAARQTSVISSSEPQQHEIIRRLLREEECRYLLELYQNTQQQSGNDSQDELGLLGLSSVFKEYDEKVAVSVANSVSPQLVNSIRSKVDRIKQFFRPNGFDSPSMANFVQIVSKIKAEVEDDQRSLEIEHKQYQAALWEYFGVLAQVLNQLVEILQDNKINKNAQHDQLLIKFLQAKAQTMIRKLSVLQTQLLVDTYTPTTVPALAEISKHLSSKLQTLEQQVMEASKQLDLYESVGEDFLDLVKEYVTIMEHISDKQWALDQLNEQENTNYAQLKPNR